MEVHGRATPKPVMETCCVAEEQKVKWEHGFIVLKAVDTISNCHRLAFTVGVSQHMHKMTNL